MDYSHAKFQVYRVCKKGIKEGGPNQPPPRLPTASNTLGLIGLKTKEKNSSFSLIHTNIQSLLKNKDSLELLCNELDFDFYVIAVTETWHNQANNALFDDVGLSIPGYQSYIGQKMRRNVVVQASLFLRISKL